MVSWHGNNPLNTWRNNNVVITSKRRHFDVITPKWRRFDVITTSLLRNVSVGNLRISNSLWAVDCRTRLCLQWNNCQHTPWPYSKFPAALFARVPNFGQAVIRIFNCLSIGLKSKFLNYRCNRLFLVKQKSPEGIYCQDEIMQTCLFIKGG